MNQLLLLGLLTEGRMHGYQMNEILSHFEGFIEEVKPGTAYNALRRLEGDGFIEASLEREGNRPERKVYELTSSGRELFLRQLRENLSQFQFVPSSDQAGLFFIEHLPKEEVAQLLKSKRIQAIEMLEKVQQHPPHGESLAFVMGHAIAQLEASVRWLDKAIERLNEKPKESDD